ncbi:MAG: hypothetical protein JOY78_15995 [Pseudonocardia sp.]|nr:hypothetical protein [Pseudonocardia sp.]
MALRVVLWARVVRVSRFPRPADLVGREISEAPGRVVPAVTRVTLWSVVRAVRVVRAARVAG